MSEGGTLGKKHGHPEWMLRFAQEAVKHGCHIVVADTLSTWHDAHASGRLAKTPKGCLALLPVGAILSAVLYYLRKHTRTDTAQEALGDVLDVPGAWRDPDLPAGARRGRRRRRRRPLQRTTHSHSHGGRRRARGADHAAGRGKRAAARRGEGSGRGCSMLPPKQTRGDSHLCD